MLNNRKLLFIGWDAADWEIIDPLVKKGRMPNLSKLMKEGVRSNLRTMEPKLSPLLWTTIATGKSPAEHGILNFLEISPEADEVRISRSTSRQTKAIWNILSQNKIKTNVINWYASHPAERIDGIVITNQFGELRPEKPYADWPAVPLSVHPENYLTEAATFRVHPSDIPTKKIRQYIPDYGKIPDSDYRKTEILPFIAQFESIKNASLNLLTNSDWQATFVFFETIDVMGHVYMPYRLPRLPFVSMREVQWYGGVMDQVYMEHDRCLGELLEAVKENVNVILVSDHGFHASEMRPDLTHASPEKRMELEASWHRENGIFLAWGPDIHPGSLSFIPNLLDLTPTVLDLFGLPKGRDMSGKPILSISKTGHQAELIDSWDTVPGNDGIHPPNMQCNSIENVLAIQQLIDLGYLAALPEKIEEKITLVRNESLFNLGVSLLFHKRYADSADIFTSLVSQNPDQKRYVYCLASSYYQNGDEKNALSALERLLISFPHDMEAVIMKSQILANMGQIKESVQFSSVLSGEKALKTEWLKSLGLLYYSQLQFEKALNITIRMMSLDPTNDWPYYLHAKALMCMGKHYEAAELCLQYLEKNPVHVELNYLLGVSLAWLGEKDEALSCFTQVHQLNPGHDETADFIAVLESRTLPKKQKGLETNDHQKTTHSPDVLFGADALADKQIAP